MMFRDSAVAFTVLISILSAQVFADEGLDKPFTSSFARLEHAACTSLFYRNGRLGCGTEDTSLQVGQLKYFDGSLPDMNKPYVAVMDEEMLTADSINTLVSARGGYLQGILVLNSTSEEDEGKNNQYYSPDSQYPRGYGTPSANLNYGTNAYAWNPKGQGLFEIDMHGIPMAYVIDSDVSKSLREEAQSVSEAAGDNIVAEFNYYMGPDKMNSAECLAWKDVATGQWNPKCLPIGGTSVWATPGSPPSYGNSDDSNANNRPVVVLAAGMDSTSMFHDISPGANTAASNILTVVMAARLIGKYVSDSTLDSLPNRIVLALFEAEQYGFVGSRSFFKDVAYPGFECKSSIVRSVSRLGDKSDLACINPVRPSMKFTGLGQIKGMLSVDQLGYLLGDGIMYVHADNNNDMYGAFLANILKRSGTNNFSVTSASVSNNNNAYPLPPSPLTSLLHLSEGAVGGAVLSGYDYAFTNKVPYHSHRDSADYFSVNLKSIAAAATIAARSILAAAYDNGSYDYATSATYAKNLIGEMSYDDADLVALANCLFHNGQCDLIQKYSSVDAANERIRFGRNMGSPNPMSKASNFYAGVYHRYYGQPVVAVGDQLYGAYNGKDYGNKDSDAIHILPEALESAIHGLFNDYLGRGSNSNGAFTSCKTISDCGNVDYCSAEGDRATCTGGGVCVCERASYHVALDEALLPAENKPAGYFVLNGNDEGISAMYTEPNWSNDVGVRVYRDAGWLPGFLSLAAGVAVGSASIFAAFVLRVGLKKEKLY